MKKIKRWEQRAKNFKAALTALEKAVEKDKLSDLEVAGLVQTFEFSFELAWKLLQDRLVEGDEAIGPPREILKKALQYEWIQDGEKWLEALVKRNQLAHIYDQERSTEVVQIIKKHFYPMLKTFADSLSSWQ